MPPLFATDRDRLEFLLEAEAELRLDPEQLTAEARQAAPDADRPRYVTNYIGSKQKLVEWIWKHTPESVGSVIDAFSGSAVVAYMYKARGLKVIANDRLRYAWHTARAIIENDRVTLSAEEIDALVADNPKAGTFVRDTFKGLFFEEGVHAVIDAIRANCDALDGFKKDIALFALGKTCASGGFGHFTSTQESGLRKGGPEDFRQRFRRNAERINALVFANGESCKAVRRDVSAVMPQANVDLAYFDPPYATEFSTTNYERAYHFVEGLMTYWDGLKIVEGSKTKFFESDHETVTKGNAKGFFQAVLSAAGHIPHWMISYRDHAYPNEEEMKALLGGLGRQAKLESTDHQYLISGQTNEASKAKEYLFIAAPKPRASKAACSCERHCHTSLPVEIALQAQALDLGTARTDPQFTFTLCRAGTNRNGDHFTAEELAARHSTAVNKKIDLQHSQEFADIVGGIVSADYVEDEKGGRVECVGELYTAESEQARLAHKLIRKGIIAQVSMECDYAEGECSICGKRVKSKADYCVHLAKYKGGEFQGKPVHEILHGVTFTGLGLLDRKGADENARITQVASEATSSTQTEGGPAMDGKEAAEAAKKKDGEGGAPPPPMDDKARMKELEAENKALKAQIGELQKRIQELEAEQKSAANRTRAQKLLRRLEKHGLAFGSDEERETEVSRLAKLNDEAFAATEAAYDRALPKRSAEAEKPAKASAKEEDDPPMRSDAGVRPLAIDDKKLSLEDRLKSGFRAAHDARRARLAGATSDQD